MRRTHARAPVSRFPRFICVGICNRGLFNAYCFYLRNLELEVVQISSGQHLRNARRPIARAHAAAAPAVVAATTAAAAAAVRTTRRWTGCHAALPVHVRRERVHDGGRLPVVAHAACAEPGRGVLERQQGGRQPLFCVAHNCCSAPLCRQWARRRDGVCYSQRSQHGAERVPCARRQRRCLGIRGSREFCNGPRPLPFVGAAIRHVGRIPVVDELHGNRHWRDNQHSDRQHHVKHPRLVEHGGHSDQHDVLPEHASAAAIDGGLAGPEHYLHADAHHGHHG